MEFRAAVLHEVGKPLAIERIRMTGLRFGSLMGEKRIVRSSYGGARPRRDFPWLAQLYLAGELKLDELITRRITLEEINAGFEAMAQGEIVRAVVAFAPCTAGGQAIAASPAA